MNIDNTSCPICPTQAAICHRTPVYINILQGKVLEKIEAAGKANSSPGYTDSQCHYYQVAPGSWSVLYPKAAGLKMDIVMKHCGILWPLLCSLCGILAPLQGSLWLQWGLKFT